MKVYVLTSGIYSNYHVVGIFSSEAKALGAAESMGLKIASDQGSIDEYEMDEFFRSGMFAYRVTMNLRGNDAQIVLTEAPDDNRVEGNWRMFIERNEHGWFRTECWARDSEHALKIANERRIQWLSLPGHEEPKTLKEKEYWSPPKKPADLETSGGAGPDPLKAG